MRRSAILAAFLSAWPLPLSLPGPGGAPAMAQPLLDLEAARPYRCDHVTQWLTRCEITVAATGPWEITARAWLRRSSTLVPLVGDLRIRVNGLACGRPVGVSLRAAQTGVVNHTLAAQCAIALTPGAHRIEGVASFRNATTGSDMVEVRIAPRRP